MSLQPGLYKATVRGVPDTTVMIDGAGFGITAEKFANGNTVHGPEKITGARPLIVLDLSDYRPDLLANLIDAIDNAGHVTVAECIRNQTKPPRIPEPGLWGVVEAAWNVTTRVTWVHDQYGWVSHSGQTIEWRNLIDPTLIRDGIEATS